MRVYMHCSRGEGVDKGDLEDDYNLHVIIASFMYSSYSMHKYCAVCN